MNKIKYNFKFECKGCGKCCRDDGFVYFTHSEIKRASALLEIRFKEFILKYLTKYPEGYAHSVAKGGHCVFLKSNRCIINSAKPKQCSTFPYWKQYINKKGELVNFDRKCIGIEIDKDPARERE